jgi:uncharacterized protein YodC (DUF2158 family)
MAKYGVGDQVRLKSGSPSMTVRDVRTASALDVVTEFDGPRDRKASYECQWFSGSKLSSGFFPEDSLEPVVNEKEPKAKTKRK